MLDTGTSLAHAREMLPDERNAVATREVSKPITLQWLAGKSPCRGLLRWGCCLLFAVAALQLGAAAEVESVDMALSYVRLLHNMGSGTPGGGNVAVDLRNSYFVVGDSSSSSTGRPMRWGTIPGSTERWHGYLVKYDRELNCLWSQEVLNTHGLSVAVSVTNDLFVGGQFEKTLQIGDQSLVSLGEVDGFVAKFTAEGKVCWLQRIGGPGKQIVTAVASDPLGNCYIAGDFRADTSIGGETLSGGRKGDVFVAKFDPSGGLVWVARSTGDYIESRSLAVDASDNVFLTGGFSGSVTFGSRRMTAAREDGPDMFLAKFDPRGACVWATHPGGPRSRYGSRVAVDSQGNSRVVGSIQGTTAFGSTNFVIVNPTRYQNMFTAQYRPDGEFHWVRQFNPLDFDFTGFVAATLAKTVRTPSVGSITSASYDQFRMPKNGYALPSGKGPLLLPENSRDIGIAEIELIRGLGTGWVAAGRLAVDTRSNYFFAGHSSYGFHGPSRWGTIPTDTTGRPPWHTYLVKYDPGLNCLWSNEILNTLPWGIAAYGADDLFLAAEFSGRWQLSGHSFESQGDEDGLVARFSGSGVLRWARQIGGPRRQKVRAVTADGAGNCYVTGEFQGVTTIGGETLTPVGQCNILVAKFDTQGTLVWVTRSTGGYTDPRDIALDTKGNLYVTGYSGRPASFDGIPLSSMGDMFLAKFDPYGKCVWSASPGGLPGGRFGNRIAVDNLGNVHVSGSIQGTTAFGSTNVVFANPNIHRNLFTAQYGPNGDFHWVRQFRSGDFTFSAAMATELARAIPPVPVPVVAGVPGKPPGVSKSVTLPAAGNGTSSVTQAVAPATVTPKAELPVVQLLVERVGDSLVVAWPKEFATHQLEGSVGIAPMPVWEPVPFAVEIVGDDRVVTIPLSRALGFYRLRAP